jgi:hypothetical protein
MGGIVTVCYLIEGIGGLALFRYEFGLAKELGKDDVWMNWTGIFDFQVSGETAIAVDSPTNVQAAVYAADFVRI